MGYVKKVVVFGVFDLLHPGHLYFLREAKKYGAHLVVVVTRDARAQKEKGRKPFFNERERLEMVRALRMVDRAILGDKVGEWHVLKRLRPDAACIGYDQNAAWIKKCRLKKMPKVVKIKGWKTRSYHSFTKRSQLKREKPTIRP